MLHTNDSKLLIIENNYLMPVIDLLRHSGLLYSSRESRPETSNYKWVNNSCSLQLLNWIARVALKASPPAEPVFGGEKRFQADYKFFQMNRENWFCDKQKVVAIILLTVGLIANRALTNISKHQSSITERHLTDWFVRCEPWEKNYDLMSS